jgi:uncharacterized iron-regulated protein
MFNDLLSAQIIFVGELHDNMAHHQLQLDLIKAFKSSGVKFTIGLEMFRAESQPVLDLWSTGGLELFLFKDIYSENWTIPWEAYDSILLYARNNNIPLVAMNAPKSIMQKVYRQGFSSLSKDEKDLLPADIGCSVDRPYMDFIRRNYVWHSDDESSFRYFCEAQLLRNKMMAINLLRYLIKHPDEKILVLTGVGHAMRRGVPDEVTNIKAVKIKIVMPQLDELAAEALKKGDADYILRE